MHILSLALGGCLRSEPVCYGITEDTGGHIAYVIGEMRALAAHPDVHHAEIVTRAFDEPQLGAIHAQSREQIAPNCTITRIDSGNRQYLSKEALAADRPAFVAALIAELRKRDRLPDLIHAHFADAADVAEQVRQTLGIPYVYTAHSLAADKLDAMGDACRNIEARLEEENRAIANAAAVIGSSRDECERQLFRYSSAQMHRIHRIIPGVATPSHERSQSRSAKELIAPFLKDENKPIILAVARAVHKKNLAALIDAFAASKLLRRKANLVILAGQRTSFGEGEAEQVEVITDILQRIDQHDLYGSVAYPKAHSTEHVTGLYQLAAQSGGVFVNPALMEPYGLTIVEAAAHGLPVVATRFGGPLDTIGELEHGLLVDPRDPRAIGSAVETLLSDNQLWTRCSENGRSRSQSHSWANYAANFMKIVKGIVAKPFSLAPRRSPAMRSLIVSDIDGTLTGCAEGVGRLHAFLKTNADFGFVVATGRSIIEAQRLVREWDIPEPLAWITSVGSEIYWTTSNGPVRDRDYPALAKTRWEPEHVEDILATVPGLQMQPVYEQRDFKRSCFFSGPGEVEAVRSALHNAGLAVRVIASHERLLDILPASAGKAAAMQHVGAKLKIAPQHIVAAGDSGNDIDMLEACDNAILVQNHEAALKRLAQRENVYVSRRPHAHGVVEGLERHQSRRTRDKVPPALEVHL